MEKIMQADSGFDKMDNCIQFDEFDPSQFWASFILSHTDALICNV